MQKYSHQQIKTQKFCRVGRAASVFLLLRISGLKAVFLGYLSRTNNERVVFCKDNAGIEFFNLTADADKRHLFARLVLCIYTFKVELTNGRFGLKIEGGEGIFGFLAVKIGNRNVAHTATLLEEEEGEDTHTVLHVL